MDVLEQSKPKLHNFLGQELLTLANLTDGGRCSMFASNISQALILSKGEFPLLFTGYERHLWGPAGFQRNDTEIEILRIIPKHAFTQMVVYRDVNGVVDCVEISTYTNSTQHFGYRVDTRVGRDIVEGSTMPADSLLWRSSNYDDNLNPLMGVNLNVAYQSWGNYTYEDAVVISESAAEKLSSDNVSILYLTINTNDVLLPLYPENRTLPQIGEPVKDCIVMAMRRWSAEELFTDFSRDRMHSVNPIKDVCLYSKGIVTDVTIYSNCSHQKWEQLLMNPQMEQIDSILKQQNSYYRRVVEALEPFVVGNTPRQPNVNFFYGRYSRALNPEYKWTYDNRKFDHLVVQLTVANRNPVKPGAKLVTRYGGKGVVSRILKDFSHDAAHQHEYGEDMMPCGQDNVPVDIILNPLGIIGRLNLSSLYELELNRIASKIVEGIHDGNRTPHDLIEFLSTIDFEWGEIVKNNYVHSPDVWMHNLNTYGPYIRAKPFWNNLCLHTLRHLYMRFPEGAPSHLYLPQYRTYTRRKVPVGKMLIMRLEHDPATKFIARGAGIINPNSDMPGRSTVHRHGLSLTNQTPVRAGEQEQFNLMLLFGSNPDMLRKFINSRSVNREDRERLLISMLTGRVSQLKSSDFDKTTNRNQDILRVYLMLLGIEMEKV